MNIILPLHFKSSDYLIEYNEPDSTPDQKNYTVRIESIKSVNEPDTAMDAQTGKEFEYIHSENIPPNTTDPWNLIRQVYHDHISKDVDCLERV